MQITAHQIDLEHRASFLLQSRHKGCLVAADREGNVTILNSELVAIHSYSTERINGIALHPSGEILATANENSGSLTLRRIDGPCFCEIAAPPVDDRWPKWKGFPPRSQAPAWERTFAKLGFATYWLTIDVFSKADNGRNLLTIQSLPSGAWR